VSILANQCIKLTVWARAARPSTLGLTASAAGYSRR
jgi:hypothetical protein